MDARMGTLKWMLPILLVVTAQAVADATPLDMDSPADTVATGRGDIASAAELERTLWLHDAQVEAWFDPATLAAMDALLLDPVPLNRGAVMRLAVLPWLDASHLEEMERAPSLRSWRELARLPGWSEGLARSIMPFVRLEPAEASWSLQGRTLWTTTRREARWSAAATGWSAAMRLRPEDETGQSGFIASRRQHVGAVVGDLRLGFSQGLLWWSSETNLRASSAPFRRASPIVGTDVGSSPRVVRGIGIEAHWGRVHAQIVRGRAMTRRLMGAVGELELAAGMVARLCWLQLNGKDHYGVAWGWTTKPGRVEIELVPQGKGHAMGLAAERRWGGLRLATRLQETSASRGASMAAASVTDRSKSSRHALLQASLRQGRAHLELALHRSMVADSLGTHSESFEQRWGARWNWKAQSFEARLRQRHGMHRPLGLEGPEPAGRDSRRGVVLRYLRSLGRRSSFGLDYRVEDGSDATRHASGSAWQVHLQHRVGLMNGHVALTSFAAPSGMAAPVVADPGIGAAPASRQLVGDGVRVALALRARTQRFEAASRLAHSFIVERPRRLEWEVSLRLQLR